MFLQIEKQMDQLKRSRRSTSLVFRWVSFMSLWSLCFALLSCSASDSSLQSWMARNGRLKILSTTAMINDLVQQVGGDAVDTTVLIKGDLDPHSYQLVKGDDEKLAFADLIFANGLGLEHGPSLQKALTSSSKAIRLGDLLQKAMPERILTHKGQIDPHIWMDVSLWAQTVPYIVQALSQKDPAHAGLYQKNAERLQAEMQAAHLEITQILHSIPAQKRYLITSHDAFEYFTRAYLAEPGELPQEWMERFTAPEGLAPESQISAADINAVIQHLKKYRVQVIFPESNVNRDSLRKIAQAANEQGIKVHLANVYLYADAMGKPGSDADSYLKMVRHDAQAIAENLKKNGEHHP